MKRLFTLLISCVAVAILMAPFALAQTPDGATPANEGVCDDLKGFTPGLYGLCVAFCEAQDLASLARPLTEDELGLLEEATPSGRILANYDRKRRSGDPDMPCIKVEEPCPCWDSAALDLATLQGPGDHMCRVWNRPDLDGSHITQLQEEPRDFRRVISVHRPLTLPPARGPICNWIVHFDGVTQSNNHEITVDQHNACNAQIRQRQIDLSLTCIVSP